MAQPTSAEHARLGTALRTIRKEKQLTIEELAGKAKLNPRYLAGVERGEI
ncbi:MAG: helix-turn-helix domain-containing protein, partial [Solirubrobacteraceae bacterium]